MISDPVFEVSGHIIVLSMRGVMVAAGLMMALWWCFRRWPLLHEQKVTLALCCLLAGVLASKAAYAMVFFPAGMQHPDAWEGGTWYGAQLACMVVMALFCLWQHESLPKLVDATAPPVAAMLAVFRIGCLFAGCCYGTPTHLPWAITYGPLHPTHNQPVHPTPLYECLILLGLTIFLLRFEKRKPFDGTVALLFLILYGTARFFLDYVRGDRFIWNAAINISYIQLFSLLMVALGIGLWLYLKNYSSVAPPKLKPSGFTLTELLLALVILGVIASFTIPKVLVVSQYQQQIAVSKEAASAVSGAWSAWKLQNQGQSITLSAAMTNSLNYTHQYTGLIDMIQSGGSRGGCSSTGGSADCSDSANFLCYKLASGAVIAFAQPGNALGVEYYMNAASPNGYAVFMVDPDGTFNGVAPVLFALTYSGRVAPPEYIDPATYANTLPPWFKW